MQGGRDVLWILPGRTDSNLPSIKIIVAKHGLRIVVFYLIYNTKQMQQYGHLKKQRGLADTKSEEQRFFC